MHVIIGDVVFADKPSGVTTHQSNAHLLGYVEYLQSHLGTSLHVVHRLDRETTGAICFAKSKNTAAELFEFFNQRKIKKTYLFLTAQKSEKDEFTCSIPIDEKPSETVFKRIKRNAFCEMWQAEPLTGRPHQIRKHAQASGISILGDQTYQGKPFPHLCLHSASLEIPGYPKWTCPEPLFFKRMGLAMNEAVVRLLSSADRRQRLFDFLKNRDDCFRLFHFENQMDLAIDKLGPKLFILENENLSDESFDSKFLLEAFCDALNTPKIVRSRVDRGNAKLLGSAGQDQQSQTWMAFENSNQYHFKSDSGMSAGLFLDQRLNRLKVHNMSQGKSVLNLFAYTCGFSLAAAKGKASKVVSVDTSQNYLDWGQENFKLNQCQGDFQFIKQDSMLYLRGAIKRKTLFDLIIIDPPSFSRGNKNTKPFKIDKDLPELIQNAIACLNPKGQILVCTNFEKWSPEIFEKKILKSISAKIKIQSLSGDWDFELPGTEPRMKSALLSR